MARRRIRCRLGLHSWRVEHTEDGSAYRRCRRCGKDLVGGGGSMDDAWPIGLHPGGRS